VAARDGELMATTASPPSAPARDPGLPRSFFCGRDGACRHDLSPRDLLEVVKSKSGELWVDIDSSSRHQLAMLDKVFGFHPLAVEDTLNPRTRSKVEEYDGYLFAVIRGTRFDPDTEDPYDLQTFALFFFLGPNYLVTVHASDASSITEIADQLARTPELLSRGAERLMHAIMDAAVDAYFPLIDQIDEFIHSCEERVFESFDPNVRKEIFTVKRVILALRRHLGPQREVFNILSNRPSNLLAPEVQIYFRDIYDHVLRATDSLDTYRDLASSTQDAYLTQISNRLGTVTKALSVFATLSIPFVVISGMWGMNFDDIPLSGWPHGFWFMLVLQLAIGVALLIFLRAKKWL
jgi:magnesium transporter